MMYAYDKIYLDDAMKNLGEAFDYAANIANMDLDEFMELFITSGLAKQFGMGVPKFVSGISGTELVWEVIGRSGYLRELPDNTNTYECSHEYWCGWILAYFQWKTNRGFDDIMQYISCSDILKMYPTLHEASEEKFVDTVNGIIERTELPTKLQILRRAMGYSQKELAKKSGVSLRMIQQYEQRAKDINKATGINLRALAQTIGCNVEDLLS